MANIKKQTIENYKLIVLPAKGLEKRLKRVERI
jgi:hypothetical protein